MLEAGKKFRHLVQFTTGEPTSDLTYTLRNQDGDVVLTETAPIISGQMSYLIEIPAGSNSLTQPLFERMILDWEYTTADEAVSDLLIYTIHTPIDFAVSEQGVRDLLGVDEEELESKDIDLFEGYLNFRELIGRDADLSIYEGVGDFDSYKIAKSIEAATALNIFPTLQIRLPKKYDSGTSSYERWNSIDWEVLQGKIESKLYDGVEVVTGQATLFTEVDIFSLSDRPPDAITGE